jgi:hypothetical protein
MGIKTLNNSQAEHGFIGIWHIYEMEMWNEDYFNMETQAYVEIQPNNLGDFQFGLVSGSLDGYLESINDTTRFCLTWEGQDEMDEAQGSGWLELVSSDEVEGLINLHLGDQSKFKAKKA